MANVRYNVDCPSCEASVPIRSSAMIGKKTECPKCKYRFTVPEPPGDDAAEDTPKKNTKAASGKKSKTAKSGSKKMLYVGAGVGVLAIGLLVVVAIFIFGGSGDEGTTKADTTTPANNTAKAGGPGEGIAAAMGGEGAGGPGGAGPGGAGREGDSSTPPMTPGDATPPKVDTKVAGTGGSLKDVTNLLPGDTTAVYRVNFDRLAQNATPLSNGFFDAKVRDLFRNSMTFGSDQLAVYIHCIVGPDRDPFVLLRTKSAIDEVRIIQDMKLEKIPNGVKNGREFFTVKSNAFIDSLSQAFTTQTITKMLGIPFPAPSQKDRDEAAKKKYALCVYDSQTILIASTLIMERFLDDLQVSGYPSFKSELTTTEAAPPAANPMGEGGPGGGSGGLAPAGSPGAAGGPPPRGSNNNSSVESYQNTPMKPGAGSGGPPPGSSAGPPGGFPGAGMMQPGGGPGGAEQRPPARKLFTSIPTYRTIDPPLKKTLNQLEEDEKNPPAIVYAEIIDQRVLNTRDLNDIYKVTGNATAGMLARIKLLGGSLSHLSKEKGNGTVVMEFVSDDDAKRTVAESIMPTLQTVTPVMDILLGTQTQVRNSLGQPGGNGPGGFGGADGGFGGLGGFPGGAGAPPGRGSAGAPPGSGGGFPGAPPGNEGSSDGGGFPGVPGGFPGGQGGFGTGGNGLPPGRNQGTVELTLTDKVLVIAILLNWPEDKFNSYIQPQIQRTASQMKGRMSVLTGDVEWHRLAVVSNKLQDGKRMFPRGTIDRDASDTRYRLAYPPEQRVSFFAELLPYLGHSGLRSQIEDKKLAWYSKENLAAAETWIPELLVPYYPQDSWRATHPLAEGRILGATNFVAPAGLGLDAGRYNPADPEMAKKVGITGYNWGSKPEEVKDGLSNTIYLLQAAPGTGRPWIAGGGATVVGVEDSDTPMQPFTHRLPDGRRGTYALMADGSVRFIKEGTDPKVFKALVTRAGGESITELDKTAPKIAATRPTETDLRGGPSIKTPTPTPTSVPDSAEVNDAELKKFQGTWKVTFFKMKALSKMAPPEALAQVKLEMSFDGKKLGIKVKGPMGDLPIPVPGAEIVKLDSAASPKILDMKGADGKTSQGIYEFTSDTKLKIRSTDDKSRPTKMGVPDDKSEDGYFELEKAN